MRPNLFTVLVHLQRMTDSRDVNIARNVKAKAKAKVSSSTEGRCYYKLHKLISLLGLNHVQHVANFAATDIPVKK